MNVVAHVMQILADGEWILAEENWDPDAETPDGLEGLMPEWISWAKWLAIGAGIIGLIACGIMMMIGRRNRSHLAAEGASGLLWVVAGLAVVSLAGGTVPLIVG